jgi:hypothetical protein
MLEQHQNIAQTGGRMRRIILAITLIAMTACGGGGSPQPESPRLTRIEVAPISVLLTATGQLHAFTAKGFDQNNQPMKTDVTWISSDPNAVSVSATGEANALVNVGSAQITAKAGTLESPPVNVIVAQPAPNAVLVSDAQVLTNPEPLDPANVFVLGAQNKLTLTGVTGISTGTILLASEAKPVGGRVVSATDVGNGKLEVILEQVSLPEMLTQYSIHGKSVINQELTDSGTQKSVSTRGEATWGKLTCKTSTSAILGGATFNYTLKPDISVDYALDLNTTFIKLTGTLTATLKGTLKLAGELTGNVVCKYEIDRKPIPLGGPIAAIIALEVPFGVRADATLKFKTPSLELGFENETTAQVKKGFYCGAPGTGCEDLSGADIKSEMKPILKVSDSFSDWRLDGSAGLYAYVGLDLGSTVGELFGVDPIGLLEGFFGARQSFTWSDAFRQALEPSYASKYDLKAYGELGFGDGVKAAIKTLIGSNFTYKPALILEYPLSRSPFGKGTVDKTKVDVGEATKFTVKLDPKDITYLTLYNVARIEIYQKKLGKTEIEKTPIGTVNASEGQTEFNWTWIPTQSDVGKNEFYAFVVPKFPDTALEITENSKLNVEVVGDEMVTISIKGNRNESYSDLNSNIYVGGASGSEASTFDQVWQFDTINKAPIISEPGLIAGQPIPGSGQYFLKPNLKSLITHTGSYSFSQDCICEVGTDSQIRKFNYSANIVNIQQFDPNSSTVFMQISDDGTYNGTVFIFSAQNTVSGNYSGSEDVSAGCPSDQPRTPVNRFVAGNLEQRASVAATFSGKIDRTTETVLRGTKTFTDKTAFVAFKSSSDNFDNTGGWDVPVTITITWKLSYAPVNTNSSTVKPFELPFSSALMTVNPVSPTQAQTTPWNGISPARSRVRQPRC